MKSGIYIAIGVVLSILIWYGLFGPSSRFIENKAKTGNAEQQLRNLPGLRGKQLYLYRSASFYDDGRIYLTLQSPDTPSHIDDYEYHVHALRSGWDGPYPYKLDQSDYPLQRFLIPLDSVTFADGSKIVQAYNAKAISVGSNETQSMVEFTMTNPNEWGWKYEDEIRGGNSRETVIYKIIFNRDASLQYFGPPRGWNGMNKPGDFSYAQQTLKDLPNLKGKKLLFDDNVQFDDPGHVYINLQNPDHPNKILSYIYFSREWEEDQGYEIKFTSLPRHWYPVEGVSFNAATKIANTYAAKIKETGSNQPIMDSLALDITGPKPAWKFNNRIKGKNGTYLIEFNMDGTLKSFVKQ